MTTLTNAAYEKAMEEHKISDAPEWLETLIHETARLMSSTDKSVADQVWFEFHKRGLIGVGVEVLAEENALMRQQIAVLRSSTGIFVIPQGIPLDTFDPNTVLCGNIEPETPLCEHGVVEGFMGHNCEGIVGPHEGLGAQFVQGCCKGEDCPDDN